MWFPSGPPAGNVTDLGEAQLLLRENRNHGHLRAVSGGNETTCEATQWLVRLFSPKPTAEGWPQTCISTYGVGGGWRWGRREGTDPQAPATLLKEVRYGHQRERAGRRYWWGSGGLL